MALANIGTQWLHTDTLVPTHGRGEIVGGRGHYPANGVGSARPVCPPFANWPLWAKPCCGP